MGPLPVVPGHQEAYAALDGDCPLRLVVDGLEGQAVQLAAQPVLDLICQPLVLFRRGVTLGGNGGGNLTLNVLFKDEAWIREPALIPFIVRARSPVRCTGARRSMRSISGFQAASLSASLRCQHPVLPA